MSGRIVSLLCAFFVTFTIGVSGQTAAADPAVAQPAVAPAPATGNPPAVAEAPDEASASAAARTSGRRVEVANRRSATTRVFAEPDGAFSMEQSAVPERVKRGDTWVDIDTTLQRRPDGMIAPKAAPADLLVSPGGTAPIARLRHGEAELALQWPTPLPPPALRDHVATYADVLPGVDLRVVAKSRGFAHELVVKSRDAAADPRIAKLSLGLGTRGVQLVADHAGNIQGRDAAGELVFQAPSPQMWDSTPPTSDGVPRTRFGNVGVQVSDDQLTLVPDLAMLADPNVTYPVVIDPDFSMVTRDRAAWTLVRMAYSGQTNWNIEPRDTDEWNNGVARVGHAPGYDNTWLDRSIFRFDTTGLGGAVIEESRLQIWQEWKFSHSCNPYDVNMAPVELWLTGAIGPSTSWNAQPAWIRKLTELRSVNKRGYCTPDWIGLDAKSAVQEAANGWWSDVTLGMSAVQGSEEQADKGWKRFHSKSGYYPKLYVRYNNVPNAPHSVFTSPPLPAPCRWCDGVPYVGDASIDLKMHLSDPQGGQLRGTWDIWSPTYEAREQWLASGSIYTTTLDLTAKHEQTVTWRVAGWDGALFGPLADGPRFVVDRVGPAAQRPVVTSSLYPADNAWHGGADVPGQFSFQAGGVSDIDHYLYGFSYPPTTKVDATALGGGATVTLTPPGDGPRDLHVQSVDRAGNRSDTQVHHFYVRAGNGPASQWPLDGTTTDDAFLGDRDGTVQGGPTWGSGALGSAIRLDGIDDHVTAPNTLATDASYSVAAWVKLDRLAASGAAVTAVSQDGASTSGFFLQQRNDYWMFGTTTCSGCGTWSVFANSAAGTAQANTWTHLAGVYDREANTGYLYVNGELVDTDDSAVPWASSGSVAIGRAKWGGNVDHWPGAIDEVRLYDRALSAAAVRTLVGRDNVQAGYWRFDDGSGGTADNAVEGGSDGVLTNGATWRTDGAIGGAVGLDGVNDHVVTNAPVVRTDQSYSVAAWVKLNQLAPNGGALTAVSQDGANSSGFFLQQRGTSWLFSTTVADGSGIWSVYAMSGPNTAQAGALTHLVAVYDRSTNMGHLYVNGVLAASNDADPPWNATGNLMIGRGKWYGPVDHWPGVIDEVRAYSRVLSAEEIRGIVSRDDVATGSWRLDGNATDDSGQGRHGTLVGAPTWVDGQSNEPAPTDRAVQLDGVDDHVTAPNALDTSRSFTATAWVKLDRLTGGLLTAVGQDGVRRSRFRLEATVDGRWSFIMFNSDTDGSLSTRAATEPATAQTGVWTHLAGAYDAASGLMHLYVNGAPVATVSHSGAWNATGSLAIGRSRTAGSPSSFWPGAIDDVRTYQRVLFQDEVRTLAGRDLTLIHQWRLNETGGGTAADAVGARTATLNNGAAFGPGRVGNALVLDGVDDDATTTGVGVRTDTSFTVSAMVRLTQQNGQVTAVSIDGTNTSKFRLGHFMDDDQYAFGAWVFELPESDSASAPTRAALATLPVELDTWVHLVGVYDAPNNKLWIYVNGDRRGDATFSTPWNSTGPVRIGRAKVGGSPTQAWPGVVDDVRIYTGGLSSDRIGQLHASYPA